ncbi:hypothetical protein ID866_4036 [Astraeus odoratus]|nr:hypothetical protein ID866_4036 [Astraeus odoratus]
MSSGSSKSSSSGSLAMHTMRWGIKYGKESSSQAINARSENVVEGMGMWNKYRGKNRCVVVCQGYYEWQTKGRDKLPHFTRYSDGRVMLMAGLYDCTVESGQVPILRISPPATDYASKALSWLHDRQPVILSSTDDIMRWLDTSSQSWSSDLAALLHPWEDDKAPLKWYAHMTFLSCNAYVGNSYQVPAEVGKVGVQSSKFIEPVANRKDGIQAMFAKQLSKQEAKRKREPSPPAANVDSPEGKKRKKEAF